MLSNNIDQEDWLLGPLRIYSKRQTEKIMKIKKRKILNYGGEERIKAEEFQ